MGWNSGSRLFTRIVEELEEEIPDIDIRIGIYKILIPLFEDEDCDTLDECVGNDVAFDTVWNELYPTETEEEEE